MADNVVIKIMARDMASATIRGVSTSLQSLGKSATIPTKSMGLLGKSFGGLTKASGGAIKSIFTLKNAIIGLAAGAGVQKIVGYADAWTQTANKLKLVTAEGEKVLSVQEKLFRLAQDSRAPLSSTSALYARISRSTRELNLNQQELLDVTETISKSFIVSGAGAQEMDAAIMQLGQGLASGTLRGEELNSVMEQAPRLAEAIATGMEIPFGQLRKMASEGKVTSAVLIKALQSQGSVIRGEFDQLEPTVASMGIKINNAFQRIVGLINEQTKFTSFLTSGLQKVVDVLTTDIPAALNAIPKAIAIIGRAWSLVGEIAINFWNKITNDPIGMLKNLGEFIVNMWATVYGTMLQIAITTMRALTGNEGVITKAIILAKTIIIDNIGFAWESIKATFFTFVVNPVISGFKIIITKVAEAIDKFAPETAAKLKKALQKVSGFEDIEFPEPPSDVKRAWDELAASVGLIPERIGEIVDFAIDSFGDNAGFLADFLGITPEQKAKFDQLGIDLNELWTGIKNDILEARAAANAVTDETVNLSNTMQREEPFMVRVWNNIKKAIDKLGKEGFKGATEGVNEYKESLGTIASFASEAVNDSLSNLQGGFKKAFDVLIFGRQDTDSAKEALKFLKDPIGGGGSVGDIIEDTARQINAASISGGALSSVVSTLRGPLDDFASDTSLPDKLRDQMRQLSTAVGVLPGQSSGDVIGFGQEQARKANRIVDQLESQMGLLGRLRAFGDALRDSLVESFRDQLTEGLSRAAMSGVLALGGSVLSREDGSIGGRLFGSGSDAADTFGEGFAGSAQGALDDIELNAPRVPSIDAVIERKGPWKEVTDGFKTVAGATNKTISVTINKVGDAWNLITEFTNKFFTATIRRIGDAWNLIGKFTDKAFTATVTRIGDAWNLIGQFTDKIFSVTANRIGDAWNIIGQFTNKSFTAVVTRIGDAWNIIGKFTDTVFSVTANRIGDAWNIVSKFSGDKAFRATANRVGDAWNIVGQFSVDKVFRVTANRIGDAWNIVPQFSGNKAFDVFANAVSSGASDAWSQVTTIGNWAIRGVSFDIFGVNGESEGGIISKLIDWTETGVNLIFQLAEGGGKAIIDAFKSIGSIGSGIKSQLSSRVVEAFAAGEVAFAIGQLFSKNGAIGSRIGAQIGTLLGGPIGGLGGAISGFLVGQTFDSLEDKDSRARSRQALTVFQGQGGVRNIIEQAIALETSFREVINDLGFGQLGSTIERGGINTVLRRSLEAEGVRGANINALISSIVGGETLTHRMLTGSDPGFLGGFVDLEGLFGDEEEGGGSGSGKVAATNLTNQGKASEAIKNSMLNLQLSRTAFRGFSRNELEGALFSMNKQHLIGGYWDLARGGTTDLMPFNNLGIGDFSIVARHGARVPGPPSRATGAVVHGGERILSVEEQDKMGGISINLTFQMMGNSDAEFERKLRESVPMIQSAVERGMQKKARFGQFQMDGRVIREVLTD